MNTLEYIASRVTIAQVREVIPATGRIVVRTVHGTTYELHWRFDGFAVNKTRTSYGFYIPQVGEWIELQTTINGNKVAGASLGVGELLDNTPPGASAFEAAMKDATVARILRGARLQPGEWHWRSAGGASIDLDAQGSVQLAASADASLTLARADESATLEASVVKTQTIKGSQVALGGATEVCETNINSTVIPDAEIYSNQIGDLAETSSYGQLMRQWTQWRDATGQIAQLNLQIDAQGNALVSQGQTAQEIKLLLQQLTLQVTRLVTITAAMISLNGNNLPVHAGPTGATGLVDYLRTVQVLTPAGPGVLVPPPMTPGVHTAEKVTVG